MSTIRDEMQLAFYKGPASDVVHKLSHWGICWWTNSPYSHDELVIDGYCYSASVRDGGVRKKYINLESGHWDLVTVYGDKAQALDFFASTEGLKYDWAGVGRYVFPSLPNSDDRWYCSEWTSAALQWPSIELNPGQAYDKAIQLLG